MSSWVVRGIFVSRKTTDVWPLGNRFQRGIVRNSPLDVRFAATRFVPTFVAKRFGPSLEFETDMRGTPPRGRSNTEQVPQPFGHRAQRINQAEVIDHSCLQIPAMIDVV